MVDPHAATAARVLTYRRFVEVASGRFIVPAPTILAVIHQESGGDPEVFRVEPSVRDASFGLMQVLLGTARGLGFTGPPRLLFDPATSIQLGTADLVGGVKDYGSEWLALIDYNGGPGAVWRYQHGLKFGAAVHYANVVWALRGYYAKKLTAPAAPGSPA